MDIVWENRERLYVLSECKEGEVVRLRRFPSSGPFLVLDLRNTVDFRLLFNLNEGTSEYVSPDEQVEVLQTKLHIL